MPLLIFLLAIIGAATLIFFLMLWLQPAFEWLKKTTRVGFAGPTSLTELTKLYGRSKELDLEGYMLGVGHFGIAFLRTRKLD